MTNNEIAKKILQITRTGYYEDQLDKIVKLLEASKHVSGELLFNAKCCANCKHFIDKWPYKSECNFHGSKANITHAEEQCCDNWEK